MPKITAVMIDSREPKWVQELTFGDAPVMVDTLETGDIVLYTDDGCQIIVERKTPDDLLNSLRDDRLFAQVSRMAQMVGDDRASVTPSGIWAYVMISGAMIRTRDGKVFTERETGWEWAAVQGALLSIQELGIHVVECAGDGDFAPALQRIAARNRGPMLIPAARQPQVLGQGAAILSSLPGIGPERSLKLLEWAAGVPAHAIAGVIDLAIPCPVVGEITRRKIRKALGLLEKQNLDLVVLGHGEEGLKVIERIEA